MNNLHEIAKFSFSDEQKMLIIGWWYGITYPYADAWSKPLIYYKNAGEFYIRLRHDLDVHFYDADKSGWIDLAKQNGLTPANFDPKMITIK